MKQSLPATILFWTAVVTVAVAQVMILRSTRRALHTDGRLPVREWIFALGPAILLAAVLFFSWRAATRLPVVDVRFGPVASAGAGPDR